ncbi:MAG TPA: hypothetical protein EYP88_06240 [Anaerolineales bacterium]|nr:hypothetical protein [Anaerolineales bacterium]
MTIGGVAVQVEPTPFGEGAAVLVAWAVSMSADKFEDIFGSFDVALNIFGDIIGGNTYRDTSTNELVIGQDTLLTALEQSVDFAIPGAWADLVLNAGGTAYDLSKVKGWLPDLLEMRIPIDPDSGLPLFSENYLVLYPGALPEDSRARREMLRLLGLRGE